MPLILTSAGPRQIPTSYAIPRKGLYLGRSEDNAVCIDANQYPMVSGRHAVIELWEGRLVVTDLQSKNGTYVNRREVHDRTVLSAGDIVQLGGHEGPSYRVVATDATLTQALDRSIVARREARTEPDSAGEPAPRSSVHRRTATPRSEPVSAPAAVTPSAGKNGGSTGLIFCGMVVVAGALGWIGWTLHSGLSKERDRVDDLSARLQGVSQQLPTTAAGGDLDKLRQDWQQQQQALLQRILAVEQKEDLNGDSPMPTPGKKLARVYDSSVLVVKRIALKERHGDRYLYRSENGDQSLLPLDERDGFYDEATEHGSGFCISRTGLIVTSTHVVVLQDRRVRQALDVELVPVACIDVIFNGSSKRRRATVAVVGNTSSVAHELAVLRVDPFPRMPWVPMDSRGTTEVDPGDPIFVFAYPFGRDFATDPLGNASAAAPSNNDEVVACIFSGNVSRRINGLLQLQATIYPGCSGGAVTNTEGQIVALVVSVQGIGDEQIAENIGYALPARSLAEVWDDLPR